MRLKRRVARARAPSTGGCTAYDVAMSYDKYCSASIMLAKTAEITTSFEVLEA